MNTIYYTLNYSFSIGGSIDTATKTISVYEVEGNEPNLIAEIECDSICQNSAKAIDEHFVAFDKRYTLENCDYIQL